MGCKEGVACNDLQMALGYSAARLRLLRGHSEAIGGEQGGGKWVADGGWEGGLWMCCGCVVLRRCRLPVQRLTGVILPSR